MKSRRPKRSLPPASTLLRFGPATPRKPFTEPQYCGAAKLHLSVRQGSFGLKHSGSSSMLRSFVSHDPAVIRNIIRFQEKAAISLRKIWAGCRTSWRTRRRNCGSGRCSARGRAFTWAAERHPASGWKSVLAPRTGVVRFGGSTAEIADAVSVLPGTGPGACARRGSCCASGVGAAGREIHGRAVLVDGDDRLPVEADGCRRPIRCSIPKMQPSCATL